MSLAVRARDLTQQWDNKLGGWRYALVTSEDGVYFDGVEWTRLLPSGPCGVVALNAMAPWKQTRTMDTGTRLKVSSISGPEITRKTEVTFGQ